MSNNIKISCREASFLISKKQETKLSIYENLQLAIHLFICDICKLFKKQTDFILQLLQQKQGKNIKMDANTKQRIKEALQKEIN
jgi:hypothetical protein